MEYLIIYSNTQNDLYEMDLDVKARVREFSWGKLWDYNSDADAQSAIQVAVKNNERIGLGCISTLIIKNFYNSADYLFDNYYRKRNLSQKAIYEFRRAMKNSTHHMDELYKLSKRQQTTFLERSPPTQWAQSLDVFRKK